MRKFAYRQLFTAALVLLLIFNLTNPAIANAAKAPSGITVSPAIQQISITAGESKHPIDIKLTNNKPSSQSLQISAADFSTLEDTGGLVFVGANPTQLQKKYGLAKWVSLPQTQITIAAHQTVIIKANVLNLPTLAPGGHYGALMLRLAGSSTSASSSNNISLTPIASVLLFVNKVGGDTHRLKLISVDAGHNFFSLPSSLSLRFYNDGNTHLTPRGVATITDPSGKLVSKGVINQTSNLVLPESYRRLAVTLDKISSAVKPGKYKLTVAFRFDGYDQYRFYQASFIHVSWPTLIFLTALLIAGWMARPWLKWEFKRRLNQARKFRKRR